MRIDRDAFWPQFTTWFSVLARSSVRVFVPNFHLNPLVYHRVGCAQLFLDTPGDFAHTEKSKTTIEPAWDRALRPGFELPTTIITVLKLCGTSEGLMATYSR